MVSVRVECAACHRDEPNSTHTERPVFWSDSATLRQGRVLEFEPMKRCWTAFALLLVVAPPLLAKAALTAPVLTLDGNQLAATFRLEQGFDDELVRRIESGLPSGFNFKFKLVRTHARWFDNTLQEAELQVLAMYNAVNREYLVNFKQNGKLTGSRVVRDLEELESSMTRFENLAIFTLDQPPADRRLVVRLRAVLGSHNILAFIPTKTTSDWVESPVVEKP